MKYLKGSKLTPKWKTLSNFFFVFGIISSCFVSNFPLTGNEEINAPEVYSVRGRRSAWDWLLCVPPGLWWPTEWHLQTAPVLVPVLYYNCKGPASATGPRLEADYPLLWTTPGLMWRDLKGGIWPNVRIISRRIPLVLNVKISNTMGDFPRTG